MVILPSLLFYLMRPLGFPSAPVCFPRGKFPKLAFEFPGGSRLMKVQHVWDACVFHRIWASMEVDVGCPERTC